MKTLIATLMTLSSLATYAQGSFFYDQQSSMDEITPYGGVRIQSYSSIGQSFTPSFSSLNFVRLRLFDISPNNSIGANLGIRLRSGTIAGTILATSFLVALGDGFSGPVNFNFGTEVPTVPNALYFFEPFVQSGDAWGIISLGDTYSDGSVYANSFSVTGNDLWFREGVVVVPEPSSACVFFAGSLIAWLARRKQSYC